MQQASILLLRRDAGCAAQRNAKPSRDFALVLAFALDQLARYAVRKQLFCFLQIAAPRRTEPLPRVVHVESQEPQSG